MARYAFEVGMMCFTLAVRMKLGVVVILSLRRISRLQLDTTKILRAYPQNDGYNFSAQILNAEIKSADVCVSRKELLSLWCVTITTWIATADPRGHKKQNELHRKEEHLHITN